MLGNTRFYKEETKNELEFFELIATQFEIFIIDTFGIPNRAQILTTGGAKYLPVVSPFYITK